MAFLWIASYNEFEGDAVLALALQSLSLAEKQGATLSIVVGHQLMGMSLTATGDIAEGQLTTIRASRFTILPYIVRWRRELGKTPRRQSYANGR